MTGLQIVDTCMSIAKRQFPDDERGRAECEIELLRTKVLELSKLVAEALKAVDDAANAVRDVHGALS